jgi:hypothetical protein
MAEISLEIMQQLEQAQAELAQMIKAGGPPLPTEVTAPGVAAAAVGAAGCAKADHVLMDHYFTSSLRRIWAYASASWHYRNVTATEEQGIAQVAFAADRVDVCWDDNNQLTLLRCWKSY